MRVCIVYDCLFPYTVGGAERWYRNLAERLAAEGHEVTYLTLRQWDRGVTPRAGEGVRVEVAGPRMSLYAGGRRRIGPPLLFGAGVLWHLLRRGRRYDVVHTCAFPYFSLLAAALARPFGRYRLVSDWFEVWSREYWDGYLGRAGVVGALVQRLCARVPQRAFCFSRLHAVRLREEGLRGEPRVLRGLYAGGEGEPREASREVVFAGRLIPEKAAVAAVGAVAEAAAALEGLRGVIFGDGPELEAVRAEIARLQAPVSAPGFVAAEEVQARLAGSLCLLAPSRREGYGMIVVEASAHGVPSVLAAGADNAAVELVSDGINGFVAPSAAPSELAGAIRAIDAAGPELRERTRRWFAEHREELSLEGSLATVLAEYSGA